MSWAPGRIPAQQQRPQQQFQQQQQQQLQNGRKQGWTKAPQNNSGNAQAQVTQTRVPAPRAAVQVAGQSPTTLAQKAAPVSGKDDIVLIVSTQSTKSDVGIATLVGDYAEQGTNHGRKYFQKVQTIPGHENVSVFLYYWDNRDGADFSGWWFGDQLGGARVWARASVHSPLPPKLGWRVPWDASTPQPGALVVDTASSSASSSALSGSATPTGNSQAAIDARVKKATEQVLALEISAKAVVSSAQKAVALSNPTEASLKTVFEALQKQQTKLGEVQTSLTKDVIETRKAGVAASASVTDLSKLSPRLKTVQTNIALELSKVKTLQMRTADSGNKIQESEVQLKALEKDKLEARELVSSATEVVAAVERAVEEISSSASALVAEAFEDGDELQLQLGCIETATTQAQLRITEVRNDVNVKLSNARRFSPEAKKTVMAELSALQIKITEAQKQLNPYKMFKREYAGRVQARKALTELADTFDSVELEIEKASNMCKAADIGQMSEEEVVSVEEAVKPLMANISKAMQIVAQKGRSTDSAAQAELDKVKARGTQLRNRADDIMMTIKGQRDGLTAQKGLTAASEKVDIAEQSLTKCQDAEMPFLKGIEVLPNDESDKAIGDSEAAASEALVVVNQAKGFVKQKLMEAKKYAKDSQQSVLDQLNSLSARVDVAENKLNNFRKETNERKMAALLAEAYDSIGSAEKKVGCLCECAQPLSSDKFETSTTEDIKHAIEKACVADKEAALACTDANKVLISKQRLAKGPAAGPSLSKIQTRLKSAQDKLQAQRSAIAVAAKFLKTKEVLEKEEETIKTAEEEIEMAERTSAVSEGEELTEEAAKSIGEAMKQAAKLFRIVPTVIQPHLASAPPTTKLALQQLLDRRKVGQEKLDKIKTSTKDQIEQVLCRSYTKEGESKLREVDDAIEATNDAELPYLKGIEVLPLAEATDAVAASEKAASVAQDAISGARTYVASKTLEAKSFGPEAAGVVIDAFAQLTERLNAAAQKLGVFRKDTESRRRVAQLQEAGDMVNSVELAVREMVVASEPFEKQVVASLNEEDIAEPMQQFLAAEESTKKVMAETRTFLAERQRASKDHESQAATVKRLMARLADAQAEVTRVKTAMSDHEQRFMAKRILADVDEKISTLDDEVERATKVCSPLLEHGGEDFLVGTSMRTLATALQSHMQEKQLDIAALFRIAGGGADISEPSFCEYMRGLPDSICNEEIAFAPERCLAISKRLDTNKDGAISEEEFSALFDQRCVCMKGVVVTDAFAITESKTVCKVEAGDTVEVFGVQQIDEAGTLRSQCKVKSSGETGWITLKGNSGTAYVEQFVPFNGFCADMDRAIADAVSAVNKASVFIAAKVKEGGVVAAGSVLANARTEMTKKRQTVTAASASLEALRKSVVVAKRDFLLKEKAELRAHIEARERKEAAAITSVVDEEVSAAEQALLVLQDVGKAVVSADAEELEQLENPAAVLVEVEIAAAAAAAKVDEAMKQVAEQVDVAAKVSPQTNASTLAKRQLLATQVKLDSQANTSKMVLETVRARCHSIVQQQIPIVSKAFREQMHRRAITCEQMFDELSKNTERISEQDFCNTISSMDGVDIKAAHATLLCRHIESNGLSRRRFLGFVQLYYVVVKDIAITNVAEVSTCKTIRKAERDEIIEVLEGPVVDEKSGLTRVRGRSLCDKQEGWVSVQGNAGTAFLKEVEKPFYVCLKDVPMDKDFNADRRDPIRHLRVEEILEIIEGPRSDMLPDAVRAHVKVSTDDSIGWLTVKDRYGTVFAEATSDLFVCSASVAMTDAQDVRNCKVVRKLLAGELFKTKGEPADDGASGVWRVEGKALKDGVEGWITTRGNAGTVFAEQTKTYFTVLKEVDLQNQFPSAGSETTRSLAVAETFQLLENLRDEKAAPEFRVKVRAVSDSSVGWVTRAEGNIKNWSPSYVCLAATPVHETCALEESAKVLKVLMKGERFELLEGPKEVGKELRIRGRAEKDDVAGWATLRDSDGKPMLQC